MERLNKVIAASGIASRRAADTLIEQGKVSVNGAVVTQLGTQVTETDVITVSGKPLPKPQTVVYLLHKPKGVVSSRAQQGNDRVITELVPAHPPVYPVGRLDKDSEGLILLTNDGALTQKLTHPSFEHQKTYQVTGKLSAFSLEQVTTKLLSGVKLGDGMAKADSVTAKPGKDATIELTITVHEGRHHLIRRMCATVGISITKLVRTNLAHLTLGTLKPGEWRKLSSQELASL